MRSTSPISDLQTPGTVKFGPTRSAGAVIVSKDEDFALRKILHRNGPSIVWIRLPNSRRGELLAWFADASPKIVEAFERGESFIELI
jgi:predicted nuclease of predicted toxin-antitoxin system